MGKTMSNSKLKIRNLYKIFGPNSRKFVKSVNEGMSKQELLDKHNHNIILEGRRTRRRKEKERGGGRGGRRRTRRRRRRASYSSSNSYS